MQSCSAQEEELHRSSTPVFTISSKISVVRRWRWQNGSPQYEQNRSVRGCCAHLNGDGHRRAAVGVDPLADIGFSLRAHHACGRLEHAKLSHYHGSTLA